MSDIFEKIITKEIPSNSVYEDEFVYSFLDINPKQKGHTLVIPKKHFDNIEQFNDEEMLSFFNGLKNTLTILKNEYNFEQYNIIQNCGPIAGQEVFHLHYHIIPAYDNNK